MSCLSIFRLHFPYLILLLCSRFVIHPDWTFPHFPTLYKPSPSLTFCRSTTAWLSLPVTIYFPPSVSTLDEFKGWCFALIHVIIKQRFVTDYKWSILLGRAFPSVCLSSCLWAQQVVYVWVVDIRHIFRHWGHNRKCKLIDVKSYKGEELGGWVCSLFSPYFSQTRMEIMCFVIWGKAVSFDTNSFFIVSECNSEVYIIEEGDEGTIKITLRLSIFY